MKKYALFLCFSLLGVIAFSDDVIGTIESGEVLRLGAIDGVPFALVKEEREGLLSTINEYYVLHGEEKIGPYDNVQNLTLSPDSKTIAYAAEIDGKYYIIRGKEKMGPYDEVVGHLRFSPDGKTIAYSAKIGNQWYVMKGKEKLGFYDDVREIIFHPTDKLSPTVLK